MAKKVQLPTNKRNKVTEYITEEDSGYSKTRRNGLGGTTTKTVREKSLTDDEKMKRQSTVKYTKVKTDRAGTVVKTKTRTKKLGGGYEF